MLTEKADDLDKTPVFADAAAINALNRHCAICRHHPPCKPKPVVMCVDTRYPLDPDARECCVNLANKR
jgi:hypothetical protein